MKFTRKQRQEIYQRAIVLLGERQLKVRTAVPVCQILRVKGKLESVAQVKREFPEFYSQKPEGESDQDVWWALSDFDSRFVALERSIRLTRIPFWTLLNKIFKFK